MLVGKLQTTSLQLAPLLQKLQVVCCWVREAALDRQVTGHLQQFIWVGPCPLGNLLECAPKPNWPSVQAIFGVQPSHVCQMNGLFRGMPQRIHEVNYAQSSFHQVWDRIHGHRDSRGVRPTHHRIKRLWRNANLLPFARRHGVNTASPGQVASSYAATAKNLYTLQAKDVAIHE